MLSSTPAQGEVLGEMPKTVELVFDDTLMKLGDKEVNQLIMRGPDKSLISMGAVATSDKVISAKVLGKAKGDGLYKIYYRVVSQDGHPVSGFISYTVGKEDLSNSEETSIKRNSISEFIHHHIIHIWWTISILVLIGIWAVIRRRRN